MSSVLHNAHGTNIIDYFEKVGTKHGMHYSGLLDPLNNKIKKQGLHLKKKTILALHGNAPTCPSNAAQVKLKLIKVRILRIVFIRFGLYLLSSNWNSLKDERVISSLHRFVSKKEKRTKGGDYKFQFKALVPSKFDKLNLYIKDFISF